MHKRTGISSFLIFAATLSGCANNGWNRLQAEFPEVSANCRLRGTLLERDATEKRLLRLVFRQRYNARLQASRDGSLACVENWARERGWRLVTGGV
ncbi:MAG TPA: hypothetical protein VE053_03970 [Allosphingosinicella sp.]|nr:hypothetical protein [Allosphingosinicella sp.]